MDRLPKDFTDCLGFDSEIATRLITGYTLWREPNLINFAFKTVRYMHKCSMRLSEDTQEKIRKGERDALIQLFQASSILPEFYEEWIDEVNQEPISIELWKQAQNNLWGGHLYMEKVFENKVWFRMYEYQARKIEKYQKKIGDKFLCQIIDAESVGRFLSERGTVWSED